MACDPRVSGTSPERGKHHRDGMRRPKGRGLRLPHGEGGRVREGRGFTPSGVNASLFNPSELVLVRDESSGAVRLHRQEFGKLLFETIAGRSRASRCRLTR